MTYQLLEDDSNSLFLTLLTYKKVIHLCVVENVTESLISAFVLDNMEESEQASFLSVVIYWYYSASDRYPLSFEFSQLGRSKEVSRFLKTFKRDSVSCFIGKPFVYDLYSKPKIKRRRVRA